jgi:hypothetical protein
MKDTSIEEKKETAQVKAQKREDEKVPLTHFVAVDGLTNSQKHFLEYETRKETAPVRTLSEWRKMLARLK